MTAMDERIGVVANLVQELLELSTVNTRRSLLQLPQSLFELFN